MIADAAAQGPGRALAELMRRYADPALGVREAQAAGRPIAGRVGNTAPVELFLAAGLDPVLIAADFGKPTPAADGYIDPVVPWETHAIFESAVDGEFGDFELLVLTRPYDKLFYYLKEVYRLGRAPSLPPLHMFDLMPSQREVVRRYNWVNLQKLLRRVESAAGRSIGEADLQGAIAVTNRGRALQREVLAGRAEGRISGVEAMQVIGAGYFMAPAPYADLLSAYVKEAEARPAGAGAPRLLIVTAEPLQHLNLHRALEAAGARVVAEDDWWGARAPGGDIAAGGPALAAIFDKYWLDTAVPDVAPREVREAWLDRHAQLENIDAVVFYLPPSDRQLGWDYPRLKTQMQDRNIPTLLLHDDARLETGRAAITEATERFLSGLGAPGKSRSRAG